MVSKAIGDGDITLVDKQHKIAFYCNFFYCNYFRFVLAGGDIEVAREKRRKEITTRRKLVDVAKIQAQEVAVLRAEVERLRMKTFPALVQIDQ